MNESGKKSKWQQYKENLGESRPWDLLNPFIDFVPEDVMQSRLDICKACPELIKLTNQCKKCGCLMHLKTKVPHATCPLGKW
jgi:hypothetical protein